MRRSSAKSPQDPTSGSPRALMSRRRLVRVGGATLGGASLASVTGCASMMGEVAPSLLPHVEAGPVRPETVAGASIGALNGGSKPVYVTRPGSTDPVEHAVADTLFGADIMMEHGMFFVMLMPGEDLAQQRGEAERFRQAFASRLTELRAGRLDPGNYAAFNRGTLDMVRSFMDYKQRMEDAQSSGQMHSSVWPTFFDHTRKEAERFAARLEQLNRGDVSYSRAEVVPFWADKMEEHAQFIAHLLDPNEDVLIEAAEGMSETFGALEASPNADRARDAVQLMINFKTAAGQGIDSGAIDSIIHPALADHVRREAVRFQDELSRAT